MANSDIKIDWVDISKIQINEKNRNIHPPEQITEFIKQFKYQGFRQPLIISNQSGKLVVGHGRLAAAEKMGLTKVPVSYQDFSDSDMEYAFATADNALAQWSSLDKAGINIDLKDLGPDLDLSLLGIKDFELEPADFQAGTLDDQDNLDQKQLTKCPECSHVFNHAKNKA